MNQADLNTLVSGALNRSCGCQAIAQGLNHGNTCPQGNQWHTWRRKGVNGGFCVKNVVAFIGVDGGSQNEIFKVNYASNRKAQQIIMSARQNAVPSVSIDPDHHIRVMFNTAGINLATYRQFYENAIQQGINE